ncbi:non-specific serine/threonine protein kinase [Malassezia nana]|uniref:non-specific serine/threonine protein kinase n=1 Tax=Malassezia nana TaxID=180528 RepID=A0AAF0ELH6_9BASI|nr:non-specific serine/threonine protein kinase [Malassezia nana]
MTRPEAMQVLGQAALYVQDAWYALLQCLSHASIKSMVYVNGTPYEIVRLLGEGGFSMVYLVRDARTHEMRALKKHGPESVREAFAEIEAMRRFRGPHTLPLVDAAVVQDDGRGASLLVGQVPTHDEESLRASKTVYLVLPYMARGHLQDEIHEHAVRGTRFDEARMLRLFLGACEGVRCLHRYTLPHIPVEEPDTARDDASLLFEAEAYPMAPPMQARADGQGKAVPYAHRDIKPANILVSDDGETALLMDFGSTIRARVPIRTRRDAVAAQDVAAERSSMPYRAPELFDVQTDTELDEKVDIWSLGCTLYAMAYLHSPFETPSTTAQGGSLALAISNGAYSYPDPADDPYSDAVRSLIAQCLVRDPAARPNIDELIERVRAALP